MSEELEAELNNWSVQELKDVLDRYKLSTAGLKKALIARLAASGQYTLAGPDYDRWTVTALKAAARKAGISASVTRRSLVIDKLRQANEQKQPAAPAVQSAPSPKRRASSGASPSKAASPGAASPAKRRNSSGAEAAGGHSPSPTITISPRRRKLDVASGPITKRETSPIFGSPSTSPQPVAPPAAASPTKRPRTPEKQKERSLSPPKPTPVKSILSPRKAKLPGETPKKVVLGEVAIRHFPRCHGGSLGMPHSGGYPIGLDWKHTKETRSPLHEYERQRHGRRKSSNDLEPLTEDRRKEIAESTGALEEVEAELDVIRSSRTRVGCGCDGDEPCSTKTCVCVAHGIACSQDACDCDDSCCMNELRDRFESDKVDKLRKEKVVQANQELQSSNSSPLQNLGAMVRHGVKRTLNFLSGSNDAAVVATDPVTQ